jgi:hypothetical protein
VERLRDWWMHDPGSHPRLNNCFIMNNNLFYIKKKRVAEDATLDDGRCNVRPSYRLHPHLPPQLLNEWHLQKHDDALPRTRRHVPAIKPPRPDFARLCQHGAHPTPHHHVALDRVERHDCIWHRRSNVHTMSMSQTMSRGR